MAETAPLSPEAIQRRRRQEQMRSPELTLRAKAGGVLGADEKLEKLLEELLYLAERETIFTMTLERGRLFTALSNSGYVGSLRVSIEHQMLPGVTQTTYLAIPPNFVFCPFTVEAWCSLPWWISSAVWIDADLPGTPMVFFTRSPDHLDDAIEGIIPTFRFERWTTTNNHVANTANFLVLNTFYIMTFDTWRMIEEVYLKPIVEFVQETAEKRTGRPYP